MTTHVLRSGDLQADAMILRRAYETLHPGLYRYNSKAQMDVAFGALDKALDHDQTLQEAFVAFSEFAAKVRCGHTQVNPFNQSKDVVEALFKSSTRLPFYFEWLDRHMIVTRDFTPDHMLPPGTEVTRISVPTKTVLAKLLSIARADGANDSKRVAQLAVKGDSEYEAFDLYYPLFFPQKSTSFALRVRRPKRRRAEQVSVKPLTFEQRIAPIKQREAQRRGGGDALFDWKYLPDGSAYLQMPTWALYNSKWDWKGWLNEHLNKAAQQNAPALIVDLRGNEGGEDVGNEILRHLIDSPLTLSPMRRLVRYRKVSDDLVPYLDTWDKGFRDLPLIGTFPPSPMPDAGVTPVIFVKPTASDIADRHDTGLAAAVYAIRQ